MAETKLEKAERKATIALRKVELQKAESAEAEAKDAATAARKALATGAGDASQFLAEIEAYGDAVLETEKLRREIALLRSGPQEQPAGNSTLITLTDEQVAAISPFDPAVPADEESAASVEE